jgi:hypothetical protein
MRLLHARTLTLKSFFEDVPPYAILSHCWGEDEVLFSDLKSPELARAKNGFEKIERTCERAIKDGFNYCWIDTCCIDKSSSAELSEAINSMFTWYRNSGKCYAYLVDVDRPEDFANSRWFTRAWTLQELLAPSHIDIVDKRTGKRTGMEFFARDWTRLGSKGGLSVTISKITGVPREYLERVSPSNASISMRMSWAADRQATRAEDIAYSLLGIFDVNMPLLYGEGKIKAFRRLQEEIMKVSEDETLFAWESTEFTTNVSMTTDVLASDPKDFSEARDLVPFSSDTPRSPYSMTHRGLRIWLEILDPRDSDKLSTQALRQWARPLRSPVMIWSDNSLAWAALRCHVANNFHDNVMIPLRHLGADIYQRDASTNVILIPTPTVSPSAALKEVYVRNSRINSIYYGVHRRHGFLFRSLPKQFSVVRVSPRDAWQRKSRILQGDSEPYGQRNWKATVLLSILQSEPPAEPEYLMLSMTLGCKWVDLDTGIRAHPEPWCHIDDTMRPLKDSTVDLFPASPASNIDRREVTQFKDPHGRQFKYCLKTGISNAMVFGQPMFILDMDFAENRNSLDVPAMSSPAQISAPEYSHVGWIGKSAIPPIYRPHDKWSDWATGRDSAQLEEECHKEC